MFVCNNRLKCQRAEDDVGEHEKAEKREESRRKNEQETNTRKSRRLKTWINVAKNILKTTDRKFCSRNIVQSGCCSRQDKHEWKLLIQVIKLFMSQVPFNQLLHHPALFTLTRAYIALKHGRKATEVPGFKNSVPYDQARTPLKLSVKNFHRAHNCEIHIHTSVPLTNVPDNINQTFCMFTRCSYYMSLLPIYTFIL